MRMTFGKLSPLGLYASTTNRGAAAGRSGRVQYRSMLMRYGHTCGQRLDRKVFVLVEDAGIQFDGRHSGLSINVQNLDGNQIRDRGRDEHIPTIGGDEVRNFRRATLMSSGMSALVACGRGS